jgi:hypothetical protein
MCVGPNYGMLLYGIYFWNFLVSPWNRTLLENCALPSDYAASSGNFVPTFRDNLSVPSSGVKNPKREPLRMGPTGRPETSVRNHHYSLCNCVEEGSSLLLRDGSLKSRTEPLWWLGSSGILLRCGAWRFIVVFSEGRHWTWIQSTTSYHGSKKSFEYWPPLYAYFFQIASSRFSARFSNTSLICVVRIACTVIFCLVPSP